MAARLARFAVELALDDVPPDVRLAARLHALDAVGCGIAAAGLGEGTHARAALPVASGAATVIGLGGGRPAADAALANGTLCHALDFDDTHAASISHVSVVVVPAALAAAQEAGADGATALAAILAGNEAVARVGALAAPSYMTRGFHPTSVCGVFGAVAAAARVRGLDAAAAAHALGIAGSMAAGLFEYLADGADTKPIHAGWAAHAGVIATALAAAGATGPATVLEGRFGVLRAFFDREGDPLPPLPDEGGRWETPRIAYKPYPACHFVHSCVDAAAELRREHALAGEDVERVELAVPAPAVPLVLEPREAKTAPRTPYDAKFSLQYSVAAMLEHGEVGLATYGADAIADPAVLALAERVEHRTREFETYPQALPGSVTLRLRDGRVLERTLAHQRGGPENPLADDEVLAKFRANAGLGLDGEGVEAVERALLVLDELPELRRAFAPLAAARRRVSARPVEPVTGPG
jgi:2-methylcitrate dehydratase PrpD